MTATSHTASQRTERSTAPRNTIGKYSRALVVVDALGLATVAALVLAGVPGSSGVALALALACGTLLWLACLTVMGAYDARHLGLGTVEFTRVITAAATVAALVAIGAYLAGAESLRLELAAFAVGGLSALLLARRLARAWLHRQRRRGGFTSPALLLGGDGPCTRMQALIDRDPTVGLRAVATLPIPRDADSVGQGGHADWLETVVATVRDTGADCVIVAPAPGIDQRSVRRLSWRLAGTGTQLMVPIDAADLAGPRSVVRPAPRLPLVHLDEARLTPAQQALKRTGDVVGAITGLIVMLPVLALVALAVRCTSPGPVLFRQERIGRDGRPFVIVKFRTMIDGAQLLHEQVLGPPVDRDPEAAVHDPRITGLGRFLRRWSLDEFPQLWSVIRGDMSLVGPRPIMPEEMPWLEPFGQRRHLMRPGITGLWQVNGRKELDWSDRIRLDVEYTERWSPALDAVLLLRTVKAIITGDGAR